MPSLTSMVESILARARKIDTYLETHNIAYPSFDNDTLDQLSGELQDERWALANDVNELKQLSRGAAQNTFDCAFSWIDAVGLRVVYHYKLANAVPLDGTASYAEIAATSGLREDLCRRFIRLVMGNRIFTEDVETQRVGHTASSRLLATDQGVSDVVGLQLEDLGPASSKLIDVWTKYGQDVDEPEKSAYCMYNDLDQPAYDFLANQPKIARRFGGAMRRYTEGDSWDMRHILASFDWPSIDHPNVQVVDIGGGNGQVCQYLARHTEHVHYIVQDLSHVVSEAPSQLPEDLKSRIEFVEHDFFTPQTIQPSPAVFIIRYVIHNWSDKNAILMLQNIVPAMCKGTKILIYEHVLPDQPITDLTGRWCFQMDVTMATCFNTGERTSAGYERILKEADPRYEVAEVRRPKGSNLSVVEVTWTG